MNKKFLVLVAAGVMLMVTYGYSQKERTFRLTDRIAVSHDGNNWDKDDTYAYAHEYALLWAYGLQKQFVHAQICNLLAKNNNEAFRKEIVESGRGRFLFPGFDTSIQFDCVTNLPAAVADFKRVAGEGSESSILHFSLAGPMETGWQSLNATAADKRKFVRCVSHSSWNEDHTSSNGALSHTWLAMKNSFAKDGVTFVDISDQNAGLGGGGSVKWDFLKSMPASSPVPQTTWTWLRGRDFKLNGDISDCGMVMFIVTGSQTNKTTDYQDIYYKPIPSTAVIKMFNANSPASQSYTARIAQSGNVLKVSVPGMQENGEVAMFNLRSQVVAKGSMVNGIASLACPSKVGGTHVVKVTSKKVKLSQKVTIN